MMRMEAKEIDLLDEWIFPERKDPHVELSIKVLEALKDRVKTYNKAKDSKVSLKELKQAFVAGASNSALKDTELLSAGFERVAVYLSGKNKKFKKENFTMQQDSRSKEFEIIYADNEEPSTEPSGNEEVKRHNLSDYKVDSVEELYLEDYRTCILNI